MLGVNREKTQQHLRTKMRENGRILTAQNCFHPSFASRVAFSAVSEAVSSFTAGRREFLGAQRNAERSGGNERDALSGAIGPRWTRVGRSAPVLRLHQVRRARWSFF